MSKRLSITAASRPGRITAGYMMAVGLQLLGIAYDRHWHALHPGAEAGWGMFQAHLPQWLGSYALLIVGLLAFRQAGRASWRLLSLCTIASAAAAAFGLTWDWWGHSSGVPDSVLAAPHALVGYGMLGGWGLLVIHAVALAGEARFHR